MFLEHLIKVYFTQFLVILFIYLFSHSCMHLLLDAFVHIFTVHSVYLFIICLFFKVRTVCLFVCLTTLSTVQTTGQHSEAEPTFDPT
jgi:hypothetical protein